MKKIIFIVVVGRLCSCKGSVQENVDWYKEANDKLRAIVETPDNLRSEEERALLRELDILFLEHLAVENNRIEITMSRNEWKKKKLPEIFYDAIEKSIADINDFSTTFPTAQEIDMEEILQDLQKEIRETGGFQQLKIE